MSPLLSRLADKQGFGLLGGSSGGGAYFPPAYQSLIDNHTGSFIYIDPVNGDDSNNGSSLELAKQNYFNIGAVSASTMIVHYPGVSQTDYASSTSQLGTINKSIIANSSIRLVCAPGQVVIRARNSGSGRDFFAWEVDNTSFIMYGAIVERVTERTNNYMNAFHGPSTKSDYFNCVFRSIAATNWDSANSQTNAKFSIHYDNSNAIDIDATGCLYVGGTWQSNYSGGSNCDLRYSASNLSGTTTSGNKTGSAFGTAKSISSTWEVDSTNYGVYYGTYAWSSSNVTATYNQA